ncbi:hypothetical protein SO694_00013364 [Aureococcus anophagefferens]|uniref:Uncharacterized protein n=1 Tax=Aureococcus anophagefferens TaxID=44056 RepID=A0ABR1G128_AURAN|nr:hypothetical protein JL722_10492 [Aureococcus anophagefferens]KAH8075041.1 hypothetical protein JL721_1027 [Aureococcus anophagefferens]
MSAMDELKALEARVKALETDDDFGLQTKVAPPAAPAPASSAASSADTEALKSENERLKKENETMAKLLAKERYRITHLIRTVESLTPA